jgi:Fe-S cluster assembly protein SufD
MSLLQQIIEKDRLLAPSNAMQKEAMANFLAKGIPGRKHEEWKYFSFKNTFEQELFLAENINVQAPINSQLRAIQANRLVFINGKLASEYSQLLDQIPGLIVCSIAEASTNYAHLFNAYFGKLADTANESLNALNTAFDPQGSFVYVPQGTICKHPFFIQHITVTTEQASFSQLRNLWVIEANAQAHFIESYESVGENMSLTNVVSEISVAENAVVNATKLQQQQSTAQLNHYTQINQASQSNVKQITISISGAVVRNNLHFKLNGPAANCVLHGLYVTDKKRLVDNHTRVDHVSPHCTSDEKYKGILLDESTAVFNGKIQVHLDAQKTAAYQRNQNILLSDSATVYTKPQLEIFADDVKCTHGATIGRLDDKSLFYLRSRGIPENVAKSMLLKAYAKDITDLIEEPALTQLISQFIEDNI